MSAPHRKVWTGAVLGEALVAAIVDLVPGYRLRSDGVECPAVWRGGDNPTSVRVWADRGAWADARTGDRGGARDLANHLGLTLVELMERYGSSCARASPPLPAPMKQYPRSDAIEAVWKECVAVTQDDDVRAYLESRQIDPQAVADNNLARALRPAARMPSRGPHGPWSSSGYRLVVPLFDGFGQLRSLHARRIVSGDPKTVSPAGHTTRGLVFACRLTRLVLSDAAMGDGSNARAYFAELSRRLREMARPGIDDIRAGLTICEGATDYLAMAASCAAVNSDAPATIGIMSGSWTVEIASRIPDGASVCIATDDDVAGNAYAQRITETFRNRKLTLTRWKPPPGMVPNDGKEWLAGRVDDIGDNDAEKPREHRHHAA